MHAASWMMAWLQVHWRSSQTGDRRFQGHVENQTRQVSNILKRKSVPESLEVDKDILLKAMRPMRFLVAEIEVTENGLAVTQHKYIAQEFAMTGLAPDESDGTTQDLVKLPAALEAILGTSLKLI